ncbi:hypothetical protein C9J85_11045 [Haloferax sp. wsp5]|nr:hypothetical protein C9J85_11045 [Haloferax sp. wsp5]
MSVSTVRAPGWCSSTFAESGHDGRLGTWTAVASVSVLVLTDDGRDGLLTSARSRTPRDRIAWELGSERR